MGIRRVQVVTVAEPEAPALDLSQNDWAPLPESEVFFHPGRGATRSASQGHTVRDLEGGEVPLPRLNYA